MGFEPEFVSLFFQLEGRQIDEALVDPAPQELGHDVRNSAQPGPDPDANRKRKGPASRKAARRALIFTISQLKVQFSFRKILLSVSFCKLNVQKY